MTKREKCLEAVITLLMGVLFIVLKGSVINFGLYILGGALIVLGLFDLYYRLVPSAIAKIVSGLALILFGALLAKVVLYVLAVLLIIYGGIMLYNAYLALKIKMSLINRIMSFLIPAIWVIAGLLLCFNMGATVNGVIIAVGVILLVQGILLFLDAFECEQN